MQKTKVLVLPQHINKGIERYKGSVCPIITRHLENKDWNYTPYRFNDSRILLVYPNNTYALLYTNEEALYKDMDED